MRGYAKCYRKVSLTPESSLSGCWRVASMTRAKRDEFSAALGSEPVLLHAADFRWIHRPRLYWGLNHQELTKHPNRPNLEYYPQGAVAKDLAVVRWTGHARPAQWQPEDGWEWAYRAEAGVKGMTPRRPAIRHPTQKGVSSRSQRRSRTRQIAPQGCGTTQTCFRGSWTITANNLCTRM